MTENPPIGNDRIVVGMQTVIGKVKSVVHAEPMARRFQFSDRVTSCVEVRGFPGLKIESLRQAQCRLWAPIFVQNPAVRGLVT